MITLTSVEAQNKFGQLLDAAQREPVTITRRGRPVAMVVAIQEFEARHGPEAARQEARRAVAAFRGAGLGGTVEELFADRRADELHEPVPAYRTGSAGGKKGGKKGGK